ncbi:glycoside hydrolase family 18 protein [Sporormia fimetaria CBS 119925]|uniref:chitinase n=1 Tax=Sporormia fimetaria CBS 119925 TaxID=1340428 RepID=A0A6A6UVZ4_9PLEO|nr:glycoside hydrolase family 18 protein [Sporormia fimetaria CBS 119925]
MICRPDLLEESEISQENVRTQSFISAQLSFCETLAMQFNCVLLFLISFLFLHCSGQHIAHHGRHYTHAKRQIATNATDVKASLTPVKAENLSFFSDAPENFLMRQPWSAENDTEAQFHLKFAPALDLVSTTAATTDDYTCSANKPCRDHAACCNGVSGQCGFGPDFCGADVCISDCDAKAECGQYAVEGKEECPLKVCCSKWGFCGTTTDFCGDGCQGNCGDPKPSGRRARDPRGRIIAYYEAWSPSKACGNMEPEDIPVEGLTHLNFAFAYITPNTYHIVPMDSRTPEDMFTRVTSAKERNPDLKVFVALGGWTFSDNGTETQAVFPNLVKTGPSRSRFISNLIAFMSQYGFDGVDIDWEYPGAGDRGGTPDDPKNFVLLTKELRSAFDGEGKGWEITFTVPTSYWYLRWFDVHGMAQWVHWINVMSYDLHGNWDKNNPIGSIVNPHTNLTEIDEALKLLWRVGIAPEQIVLGIAFYGRSFQLANGGCTKPGCAFAGPAAKGICTGEEGILSYLEIQNLLDRTRAKPTYDQAAGIQYVVFNGNQWVSYDDSKTIKQKVDFAQKYGLSGLMTWAIDLDDGKSSLLKAMTGKSFNSNGGLRAGTQFPIGEGGPRDSSSLSSKCIVTECRNGGEMYCPNGYLFQTHLEYMGEAYSEEMDCPGNKQRSLCCPADHNPDRAKCSWTDCGGACASGEAYLVSDWVGDNPNTACSPRTGNYFRNYCCQIENMDQYFDSCMYSACSEEPKCGEKGMEEYTEELATAYHWTEKGKELCPLDRTFCQDSNSGDCPKEKSVKFCCKPKKVKSCKWKGTPEGAGIHTDYDTCMFNECVGGEIVMDRAYKGDDSRKSCFSHSPKNLCCIPGEDAEENWDIDPANLVPYDLREGDDIEVDSHVSASTPSTADFISFMSVIGNKQDVISLDKRDGSHLEFFDCKPLPGKQTVKVICTNTAEGSNCHDIHEGGLPGTVVRLPEGCGRSPWARAVSMTESQDQALTKRLVKRGLPPDAKVHEFTFDYDFTLIKRDAGKIAFRIDQSNLDNYWNNVVDSPPDDFENVPAKKRSEREELRDFFANQTDDSGLHMKRPHELYSQYKRWWGDLPGDYAFKATSGDAGGFERSLEFTIAEFDYGFRDEITCTYGSNKYKAVGEINTLGKVTGKIKFGATMYGELWPNFSFRNSYVYMRGEMKGDFALDVTSDNVWDYTSDNMQFGQRFRLPKTNYAIDGIGEIYLYAG